MSTRINKWFSKFLIWRLKNIPQKQFIQILSAIIGLLAGLGAVTLKNLTHFIQSLLEGKFIREIHQAFYFSFPIIGLLIVTLMIQYIIKKKVEHGIPSTLFSISKQKGIMSRHQMWASLLTAPVTVGFGGSVGLEGPTVATGAALGSNFARLFHLPNHQNAAHWSSSNRGHVFHFQSTYSRHCICSGDIWIRADHGFHDSLTFGFNHGSFNLLFLFG